MPFVVCVFRFPVPPTWRSCHDRQRRRQINLSYLKWALIVTAIGLVLGAWLGWQTTGTLSGMATVFFICAVLAVLEISLSFDNAIVNANKLKDMTPVWQHRFLTWGIIIAVFGMRIVFPLLIVVIAARIGPFEAILLAAREPAEYARIMNEAHLPIAAFGGTFLMMVELTYFFNHEKDVHWISFIEKHMARSATVKGIEIAFVLLLILVFSNLLEGEEANTFVFSAMLRPPDLPCGGSRRRPARRFAEGDVGSGQGRPRHSSISKCWMPASPSTVSSEPSH